MPNMLSTWNKIIIIIIIIVIEVWNKNLICTGLYDSCSPLYRVQLGFSFMPQWNEIK